MRKLFSVIILVFVSFTVNAQFTKEDRLRAAEHLVETYISVSIDPYRGTTQEEWSKRAEVFLSKIREAKTREEVYYALRYFGALSNDGHFDYPGMGAYNREKIFKKEDKIFPIIVKSTQDDHVFVAHDFSGSIPDYAELISVNGIDAREISFKQHSLVPYEPNYAYAHLNEREELRFRAWASFANYLFCENILGPYTVEYSVNGSKNIAIIHGIERQTLHNISKSFRNSDSPESKNVMEYTIHNDSIAILDINYFWGKNQLNFLFSKSDKRFEQLLRSNMKKIDRDNIKHLIVDLRSNAGGYTKNVYELISYFAPDMVYDDKSIYKISAEAKENYRGARILENSIKMIYGDNDEDLQKRTVEIYKSMPEGSIFKEDTIMPMTYTLQSPQYRYDGKVYVLVNSTSFSASTLFCVYFRKSGVGLIAGAPPAGYSMITGGARIPVNYWLGGAIPMKVSHVLNNPLEEDRYQYIMPDIPIENDFNSWIKGEDSSLLKLLDMIKSREFSVKN